MATIGAVKRDLERDLRERESAARADMDAAARTAQRTAQRLAPVDTGNLRRSIRIDEHGNRVVVVSELPYAGIQERRRGYMRRGAIAGDMELIRRGYRRG